MSAQGESFGAPATARKERPGAQGCQERHEKVSAKRLRDQQRCRDYWQRKYGEIAERLSRGGVTWLQ